MCRIHWKEWVKDTSNDKEVQEKLESCLKILVANFFMNANDYVTEKFVRSFADTIRMTEKVLQYKEKVIRYPLYEWGITECEALQYCYSKGFDWGGLYEIFNRVSCWCCPLQSLKELKNLYIYYPEKWNRLKVMDQKAFNRFRLDYTFEELEQKFDYEIKKEKMFYFKCNSKQYEQLTMAI
jgi:hypothetical protein